jgi:hypothetical protein
MPAGDPEWQLYGAQFGRMILGDVPVWWWYEASLSAVNPAGPLTRGADTGKQRA